jgi:hypothetical protein
MLKGYPVLTYIVVWRFACLDTKRSAQSQNADIEICRSDYLIHETSRRATLQKMDLHTNTLASIGTNKEIRWNAHLLGGWLLAWWLKFGIGLEKKNISREKADIV